MRFTAYEKEIIQAILDSRVSDLQSYIYAFPVFETEINRWQVYCAPGCIFQPGANVHIIENDEDFAKRLRQFLALCNRLQRKGLAHIPEKGTAKSILPIFQRSNPNPEPASKSIEIMANNINFEITPSVELEDFVQDGFRTYEEQLYDEERESRIAAQRWTIGISIAGLLIGTLT